MCSLRVVCMDAGSACGYNEDLPSASNLSPGARDGTGGYVVGEAVSVTVACITLSYVFVSVDDGSSGVVAEVVNEVATKGVEMGEGKFGTGRMVSRRATEGICTVAVYAGDLCTHSSYVGMSACTIYDYLHAEESADVGETMVDEVCAYLLCLTTI